VVALIVMVLRKIGLGQLVGSLRWSAVGSVGLEIAIQCLTPEVIRLFYPQILRTATKAAFISDRCIGVPELRAPCGVRAGPSLSSQLGEPTSRWCVCGLLGASAHRISRESKSEHVRLPCISILGREPDTNSRDEHCLSLCLFELLDRLPAEMGGGLVNIKELLFRGGVHPAAEQPAGPSLPRVDVWRRNMEATASIGESEVPDRRLIDADSKQ
jgi:hypothetical protein